MYGLRYEYRPSKADEIFKLVKHVLTQETVDEISIKKVKMNLLPTEFYTYSITVPDKGSVPLSLKIHPFLLQAQYIYIILRYHTQRFPYPVLLWNRCKS